MKCTYNTYINSDNNNDFIIIDLNKIMDPETIISLDMSVFHESVSDISKDESWNIAIKVHLTQGPIVAKALVTLYIRTNYQILSKMPAVQLYRTMLNKLKQKTKTGIDLVYCEHNDFVNKINTTNGVGKTEIFIPPFINDVMLQPMINLQKLNLGNSTRITGKGIRNLVNLVEFNAGYNNFRGEDFAKLSKITELKLRPCDPATYITYKQLAHLPLKTLVMGRYDWLALQESKFEKCGVVIKYWGIHPDA
jgi:hypothetical protein